MSLTPLPPTVSMTPPTAPTGEAVACGPGAGDPAAAGFAALVAGLLGEGPVPGSRPGTAPEVPTDPDVEATDEARETGSEADATPTVVPSILAGPVPALPAPTPVTWRPPGIDAPADPDLAAAQLTPATPATGATPAEPAQGTPATPATPASPALAAAPAASATPPRHETALRTDDAAPTITATPVVTATPVDGQSALPAATTSAPDRARTAALVDQLAPTLSRLVSRGEGVHRLTMKLQPEALGEVRVTFTVRQGEVRVHLAGTEDTQRLLADGAPELRRVLEMTGVTDARVFVRDHPTAAANPQSPTGLLAGQDPTSQQGQGQRPTGDAFGPGTGSGGNDDQQARTRAGATARDGLTDTAPTPRPEPARRDPLRGLDLTM